MWIVNSEGTRCRQPGSRYVVTAQASTQADDGMELADSRVFAATTENELPSIEELEKTIKEMATDLTNLKSSKPLDAYHGPVMLEGQAAAQFFNQLLRQDLGNAQQVLGGKTNSSYKELLGQSVLPKFLTVTDNPLAQQYAHTPLVGGYRIDNDGVRAQKIVLIDKGVLKTFCTSRLPTLALASEPLHSNGHSVYGIGEPSIVFIDSDLRYSRQQLKKELIKLGKKPGLNQC